MSLVYSNIFCREVRNLYLLQRYTKELSPMNRTLITEKLKNACLEKSDMDTLDFTDAKGNHRKVYSLST